MGLPSPGVVVGADETHSATGTMTVHVHDDVVAQGEIRRVVFDVADDQYHVVERQGAALLSRD